MHSGHDLAVTVSAVYRQSWSVVPEHRSADNRRRAACYGSTTTPVVARPAHASAARATIADARRHRAVSVEIRAASVSALVDIRQPLRLRERQAA